MGLMSGSLYFGQPSTNLRKSFSHLSLKASYHKPEKSKEKEANPSLSDFFHSVTLAPARNKEPMLVVHLDLLSSLLTQALYLREPTRTTRVATSGQSDVAKVCCSDLSTSMTLKERWGSESKVRSSLPLPRNRMSCL